MIAAAAVPTARSAQGASPRRRSAARTSVHLAVTASASPAGMVVDHRAQRRARGDDRGQPDRAGAARRQVVARRRRARVAVELAGGVGGE